MQLLFLGLLQLGALAGDFTVRDVDDHVSKVSVLRSGGPALVVYEDKDASEENARFKQRLGKDPTARKVKLVAIADVAAWDFWPAKGFVKSALRSAGEKAGITVWADWSGDGRKALDAKPAHSNLVLVDSAGKVLWSSAGSLTPAQEDDLLARMRAAAPK